MRSKWPWATGWTIQHRTFALNTRHEIHETSSPPYPPPPLTDSSHVTSNSSPATHHSQSSFKHLLHSFFSPTHSTDPVPRLSKRSHEAALVELQSTARRVFQLEQTHARQVSQAGTEPAETAQPAEEDIAEFLPHIVETSHSVLRSSYVRWRQRECNTRDTGRVKEKDEGGENKKEQKDKKEGKKRKREADDAAQTSSTEPRTPSTQARK